MSNNIMIKRLEKRLGLDLRVSRSRSWSRSIIEGLGLVSVSENFERSRSRSWSRKKNKRLGLVSVSEPKVSFTSDILYYFGHITLEYNYQNKVVSYQCSIQYCFNPCRCLLTSNSFHWRHLKFVIPCMAFVVLFTSFFFCRWIFAVPLHCFMHRSVNRRIKQSWRRGSSQLMLKASAEVVLEGKIFDHCQSNRCYAIELKIGDSDYARPPTNPAKFGEIRISGGGPVRRWN